MTTLALLPAGASGCRGRRTLRRAAGPAAEARAPVVHLLRADRVVRARPGRASLSSRATSTGGFGEYIDAFAYVIPS